MKIVSICDDNDIKVGLRLAGIEGIHVNTPEQFVRVFENVASDRHVAIVVVPEKYRHLIADTKTPLVVCL